MADHEFHSPSLVEAPVVTAQNILDALLLNDGFELAIRAAARWAKSGLRDCLAEKEIEVRRVLRDEFELPLKGAVYVFTHSLFLLPHYEGSANLLNAGLGVFCQAVMTTAGTRPLALVDALDVDIGLREGGYYCFTFKQRFSWEADID